MYTFLASNVALTRNVVDLRCIFWSSHRFKKKKKIKLKSPNLSMLLFTLMKLKCPSVDTNPLKNCFKLKIYLHVFAKCANYSFGKVFYAFVCSAMQCN